MVYFGLALFAFVIAVLTTPFARRLSERLDIVAIPGGRRKHFGRIPKLGGIPIFTAYCLTIALIYWFIAPNPSETVPLRGVVLGSIVVFVGGLLDDYYDLSPRGQFLIQFAAAVIANLHVAFLERVSNPFMGFSAELPGISIGNEIVFATPVAWAITIFWIMGIMNAVNWLDGLDGLAAGVGAIATSIFAYHAYTLAESPSPLVAFPVALAGALAGFLLFNFVPARIFLGSAGVYLLSYNLATLSFLAPAKLATALLVLALPLIDGVWLIVERSRKGGNPLQGDRRHLHFRLKDRGWPVRQIVLAYYSVALILGFVALFTPTAAKPFIILSLGLLILFGLIRLSKDSEG
ncbi:MAG: glycosyltransferase family 4 protein [Candidatus Promineifilaceae bacterium]